MRFWSTLTTAKFSRFFVLFYICGCASIILQTHVLYIAPICVVVYSLILWVAQSKHYISLSAETRDSPYFLGFLFTLTALLLIFYHLPQTDGKISDNFVTVIVPQIGTALLTTIVGLIARHLIASFSPSINEEENIWKLATEELKENAGAYRTAQERLLELVDSFIESHKDLIVEEEEASKEHIKFLTDSTNALSDFKNNYPIQIKETLESFDSVNKQLSAFVNTVIPEFHEKLREEMSLGLVKLNNDFVKKISTAYTKMTNSLEKIDPKVELFLETYESSFEKYPEYHKTLMTKMFDELSTQQNKFIGDFSANSDKFSNQIKELNTNLTKITNSFEECNDTAQNGIREPLTNIGNNLNDLQITLNNANGLIHQSTDKINKNLTLFDEDSLNRMRQFKGEIAQIDELIDSFIEVTKKKISAH